MIKTSYNVKAPDGMHCKHLIEYDNVSDLLAYLNDKSNEQYKSSNHFNGGHFAPEFHGCSWNDACNMLGIGYEKGAAEVDTALDAILSQLGEMPEETFRPDVTGQYFDVSDYAINEPECFRRLQEVPQPTAGVKVIVNVGYLGHVDTHLIFNRGAVISGVLHALSKRYAVDIEIVSHNDRGTRMVYHGNTKSGVSFDMLTFMISHPGYHRQLCFAAREIVTKQKSNVGGSMDVGDNEDGTIVFNMLHPGDENFETIGSSAAYLAKILEPYMTNEVA